ncbi:hypothetical protein Taro_047967 [Colocasia esculenta]|uniref:Uncharacterized protein n=1 Tax=Colocasia esculenta TaxID=4460 RepID=A0A843X827_COLES|nr:hypothetical protein [Colocasia esculenta]
MAAQGFIEGQSIHRPPLFDGEDYNYWKTMMEFFLQGYDYNLWTIIEEGDLIVLIPREEWIDNDRKSLSQNSKAKNLICCALTRSEFNKISACKSAKEMWDKLKLTYEGTYKVKETRIDIFVTQYEKFQMLTGETITQMYSRFTDITNGLARLGKIYNTGDMRILKKKKNGSRRIQKKEKKQKEPVYYECRKHGHLRPDCPKLKKTGQPEKSKKKHKKFKRKAMAAAWDNEEVSISDSSSSDSEEEQDSLGASGTKDAQGIGDN